MRSTISTNSKLLQTEATPEVAVIQRSPSLAHEVYEVIFAQLMALKIAPGSRITVDNLVRELNVSQTPIREALGRLEGEGLVIKTHLVGYSAAPQISRRKFDELYEMRLLLEPDAAKRAVANMNEARMKELREAAGVMLRRDGTDERIRYSTFARQDAIFHDKILDFAGNQLIRETLTHQHTHFHIFRLMFHSRVTEEALDEHEAILTAFSNGDASGAEQAMRNHIVQSRDRLLEAFD